MKEKIEQMYIQALIDDLAPNVFADQVLRLFSVVGRSEQLKCRECEDGSGWYGGEEIRYNCSVCNPDAL
jgi:hypothetical protein